jgi:hypothetical protein
MAGLLQFLDDVHLIRIIRSDQGCEYGGEDENNYDEKTNNREWTAEED